MRRTIALLVLLLAGCATTETFWEKPGASAQDFNSDSAQCRAQAFSVPGAMNNLMQVAIVQNQCMQGRGWYTVEREVSAAPSQDVSKRCVEEAERNTPSKNSLDTAYKIAYERCVTRK